MSFTALPTRVSRIYPALTLVLLIACSIFFYGWQATNIELERLPQFIEKNNDLQAQVAQLTAQRQEDVLVLSQQKQAIAQAESELVKATDELAAKQAEVAARDSQIKNQEAQLSTNATELERLRTRPPLFSFQNSSSQTDIANQQAEVKEVVSSAYDYIRQLYGEPYLLSSVTISFVDSFSIANSSGEILIENSSKGIAITIRIKSFSKHSFQDVNTIIHEMIHGFHGVAVFEQSVLEEGITVAMTDAVMRKMVADAKLTSFSRYYLSASPSQLSTWNTTLSLPADNDAFYATPEVANAYQLIGSAWYELYKADPQFFSKLNRYYYPLIQKGRTADAALVRSAILAIGPTTVQGQSLSSYLGSQRAFNPL